MGKAFTKTVTVTPVLDTSAYTAGDVLWTNSVELTDLIENEPQEYSRAQAHARLIGVGIVDKSANGGVALDLVFLNANQSLGTANAAVSISDGNLEKWLHTVPIAAGDWKVAAPGANGHVSLGESHPNLVKNMRLASGQTSLWLGGILRSGTPTYAASDFVITLEFEEVI